MVAALVALTTVRQKQSRALGRLSMRRRLPGRVAVLAALAWFMLAAACFACEDQALKIETQPIGSEVHIFAVLCGLLEATVSFEADLKNMSALPSNPVTVSLHTQGRTPIAVLRASDPRYDYAYTYKYRWNKGLLDHSTSVQGQYVISYLPYPRGQTDRVNQGFLGTYSHFSGSHDEYAVDFSLPEEATICAALPGIVIGVRDDSTEGGPERKFQKCANYVVIKHADGTYAEYAHVQPGGALVHLGQRVFAGVPIARAGHTGQADAPHLHFCIYKILAGQEKVSLPLQFRTTAALHTPVEGMVIRND